MFLEGGTNDPCRSSKISVIQRDRSNRDLSENDSRPSSSKGYVLFLGRRRTKTQSINREKNFRVKSLITIVECSLLIEAKLGLFLLDLDTIERIPLRSSIDAMTFIDVEIFYKSYNPSYRTGFVFWTYEQF